jgi:CHAT domain-containing protein
LYARIGRLRGEIESQSLPEVSEYLAGILNSPVTQSDWQLRLFCLVAKGDIDFQIDPKTSEAVWTEVAAIAGRLRDRAWENRAQAELGTIAFYKGQIYRGARMVAESYIAAEIHGDTAYIIRLRAAFGEGFAEFGHPKDALVYFDSALKLARETPDAGFPFRAYLGRARALIALGRTAEGEKILREALSNSQRGQMRVREARVLVALGALAKSRGDETEARGCFEGASRLAEDQHLRRLAAAAKSELALLSADHGGSLNDAEQLIKASIQNSAAGQDMFHLPHQLAAAADVESRRGNVLAAQRNYRLASDVVDHLISNVTPFEEKDFLLASMDSIYLGQLRLALEKHDPESAFKALEQVPARGIAESLHWHSERDRLALELTQPAAKRVNVLQASLLHERQPARRSQILTAIWEAEKRGIVIRDSDGIASGADGVIVDLSRLQRALRPDELLLEYALDQRYSILLAIDQRSITTFRLPSQGEVEALIANYLASINTPDKSAGQRLGELLLGPVWSRPQKRLIVVANGALQAVPFDALLTPDGHYLAETYFVTSSPSATILYELRSRGEQPTRKGLLGIGAAQYGQGAGLPGVLVALTRGLSVGVPGGLFDPEGTPAFGLLPGSRRELIDAAGALPYSTLLLDRSATEQRLKSEELSSYEVLHFAVHVAVDEERPDRTALVLADGPGSTEDGLLQAREIAHLRLGARLVVLSGCNTGRPVFESSFANASLVRSFLFAGAKSVVASLWTIDDTFTAYLMGQFYAYLGRGSDAGTALELAKRDAIHTYGNSGLPLWAGFQLVGNGDETIEPGGRL